MRYCASCGSQLPDGARFCPNCAATTSAPNRASETPPVKDPFARASASDSARLAWTIGGIVVGFLVGVLAVRLTNQALCPHSILGPCRSLSGGGTGLFIVGGVVLGGFVGRLIGRSLH